MYYYVTVLISTSTSTNVCVRQLKNTLRVDKLMFCIANSPPESVLNPNRDVFSPPSVCSHKLFCFTHLFISHSCHSFTRIFCHFFHHSLQCSVMTLKLLCGSYWVLEGITSKDGSSLIVYDERTVAFNACVKTGIIIGQKCKGWVDNFIVTERSILLFFWVCWKEKYDVLVKKLYLSLVIAYLSLCQSKLSR